MGGFGTLLLGAVIACIGTILIGVGLVLITIGVMDLSRWCRTRRDANRCQIGDCRFRHTDPNVIMEHRFYAHEINP